MVDAYDSFKADAETRSKGRLWYWNISRQFGKSYSCCVLALEEALRGPSRQIKYASVDGKMARAIVLPQMERILAECPADLRPQFRPQDGVLWFPNGSRITIAGVDRDSIKKLRGQQAHLAICDELGFFPNAQQVIQEVLLPQTTTTQGRLVIATTPPDSAGHYASELYQTCKSRGASETFSLDDNRLLSDAEKAEIVRDMGGRESTRYQREYECQFVTDSTNAVVPEFDAAAELEIVRDSILPPHFHAYESLDGGFSDPAGLLFAHADYERAKVVIDDEWTDKGALTADIAALVTEREDFLWGGTPVMSNPTAKARSHTGSRLVRIMDIDPEKAADFQQNHGMEWSPASKGPGSVMVMRNLLNQMIKQRMIEINPRCVKLIRQLHNATWAGRRFEDGTTPRKQFTRNSTDGHFDLVAALFYLLPEVDLTDNPFPHVKRELLNTWHSPEEMAEPELAEGDMSLAMHFSNRGKL